MSIDHARMDRRESETPNFKLRFNAGRFEDAVVGVILYAQVGMVAAAVFLGGFILLANGDSALVDFIPAMGVGVALLGSAWLLNFLYESVDEGEAEADLELEGDGE